MHHLLRTELKAVVNQIRQPGNLKYIVVGLVIAACMSIGLAIACKNLILAPAVIRLVREDSSGTVLRFLIGLVMVPALLLGIAMAVGQVRRDLFEGPMAGLLVASPVSRGSIVVWTFTRTTFSILLYGSLIEVIPLCWVLEKTTGMGSGAFLFPIAMFIMAAPLVAGIILVNVALMRWLAKPWTRMLLTMLGGLAGMAFILLSASGVMTGKASGEEMAALVQAEPQLPWLLSLPTDVLMYLMGQPTGSTSILILLITLLSPCVLLLLAAAVYERAYENAWVTFNPTLFRTVRFLSKGWPTKPVASLLRRELVQLVQQPTSLFGYVFLGFLIFMIARSDPMSLTLPEDSPVPELLGSTARVFFTWLLTALMLASMSVPSPGAEVPYLVMYKSSPVRPAALLHGRMATLLLPFGWCLVLTLLFGHWIIGASPLALLLFIGFALPTMVLSLGLITGLGTLAIPTTSGASLVDMTRMLITSIGVALAMGIILGAGLAFWHGLCRSYKYSTTMADSNPMLFLVLTLAVAWGFALLVGGLGYLLGRRNFRKILSPEA